MNKYSEWIYSYLDTGYLKHSNNKWFQDQSIGSMISDFTDEFRIPCAIWGKWDVWAESDKLQFFLFLAEVDQETANALVDFPRY